MYVFILRLLWDEANLATTLCIFKKRAILFSIHKIDTDNKNSLPILFLRYDFTCLKHKNDVLQHLLDGGIVTAMRHNL